MQTFLREDAFSLRTIGRFPRVGILETVFGAWRTLLLPLSVADSRSIYRAKNKASGGAPATSVLRSLKGAVRRISKASGCVAADCSELTRRLILPL